ncbi:MAG: methyltransferase [Alkalispirochaetaceae bacterium]
MSELRYDLTLDPGLEDIVAAEAQERFAAAGIGVETTLRPLDLPGHVELSVSGDPPQVEPLLRQLRGAYYAVRLAGSAELAPGEEPLGPVLRKLREIELPELEEAGSFRVRSRRVGEHSFSSPEVERESGTVLHQRFGTAVKLEEPECTVRVDVTGAVARIGVLATPEALSRRYPWVWRPRVTLRTTIAYGMLRLGAFDKLPSGGRLYDPFCGSGTIPIEAASLRDDLEILGSDYDEQSVEGARANAAACGLADRVALFGANALERSKTVEPGSVSAIVTNPPFGVRMAKETNMRAFYHAFLREAATLLKPEGRLVILVGKRRKNFNEAVDGPASFAVRHVRVIEFGGIYPGIFVLERL